MRFLNQLIAFVFLFAIGKKADARRGQVHDALHIDGTHQGELLKELGPAVYVGAEVDQHADAIPGRKDAADGAAFYAFNTPDHKSGRGHHRAAVASRDCADGEAIFDELKGANHRSIFVAHRSGRVVLVHGNDFVGVFDGQIETVCVMFGKLRLDDLCLPDEGKSVVAGHFSVEVFDSTHPLVATPMRMTVSTPISRSRISSSVWMTAACPTR